MLKVIVRATLVSSVVYAIIIWLIGLGDAPIAWWWEYHSLGQWKLPWGNGYWDVPAAALLCSLLAVVCKDFCNTWSRATRDEQRNLNDWAWFIGEFYIFFWAIPGIVLLIGCSEGGYLPMTALLALAIALIPALAVLVVLTLLLGWVGEWIMS